MLKFVSLLFLFIMPVAYAQQQGKRFVLSGVIKGAATQWVYLDYIDANNRYITDSCLLVKGKFSFNGKIGGPVQGSFYQKNQTSNGPAYTFLFLEPGTMTGVFQANHFRQGKVYGSKTQDEYQHFIQQEGIRTTYATASVYQFIQKHPGSFVSAYLLMPVIFRTPLDSTKKYFEQLSVDVKSGTDGQVIASFIQKEERVAPGAPAPDFTQTDINEKPVSLKDFKGKYLLIDFWASWCSPCRLENPNLVTAYSGLKDKNFAILSVSIDKDAMAWKAAVQKDNLTWPQLLIEEAEESKMALDYNVMGKGIPFNLLISPDGTMLAQNLRGENLLRQISDYMK